MKKNLFIAVLILVLGVLGFGLDDARLLRMPDINSNLVVFRLTIFSRKSMIRKA